MSKASSDNSSSSWRNLTPGLTIATSEVFNVEASQGYETTEEGTFDYTIDPSTFDNTKASDYVITLTASEVTDVTP